MSGLLVYSRNTNIENDNVGIGHRAEPPILNNHYCKWLSICTCTKASASLVLEILLKLLDVCHWLDESLLTMLLGAINVSADIFNEGRVPSLVSMVNCTGSETSILDCTGVVTTTGSGFSCPTSGVICQGK